MSRRLFVAFAALAVTLVALPALAGSLDKEPIKKAMHEHKPQLKACYETALERDPQLAGTIVVRFVIDTTTVTVASAAVTETSTLDDPAMQACVLDVVRSLSFDYEPADRGAPLTVTYPFKFTSAELAELQ